MKIGTVVGTVQAEKKAPCVQELVLLAVEVGGETLAAADLVGAGNGDRVVLVMGTAAGRCCMEAPVDAAVVAVVREG